MPTPFESTTLNLQLFDLRHFCKHMESVVMASPDVAAILARRRTVRRP